ncbi:MAG: hypothetical protein ACI8QC_001989 [Planctomycetota bacterium]|jgi:hypothetical protein
MFLSSSGGLAAGRRDARGSLFPYTTDDKLHDAVGISGPLTVIHAQVNEVQELWEPFATHRQERFELERSLSKSVQSDQVLLEERNHSLGLVFRYRWQASDRFGWVRQVELSNEGPNQVQVSVLDGCVNLMPAHAEPAMQNGFSTLLDAYRQAEVVGDHGLALVRLSSIPLDRPEPCEALRATSAFSLGLGASPRLLSTRQVSAYRAGHSVEPETAVRGERAAYLVQGDFVLDGGTSREWLQAFDVERDAAQVVELLEALEDPIALKRDVLADLQAGRRELRGLVASADGLQLTGSPLEDARHFANTLCNIMRGGVFPTGYSITRAQFIAHLEALAPALVESFNVSLAALPERFERHALLEYLRNVADPDLLRLGREYLPLTFSRRHGDPSRPWNRFSVPGRDETGDWRLGYEGNWRDIFQNWEALCVSFPGYAEAAITRFLNASTADGYNPYRVSLVGVEWELHDPGDPWSFIGYWGDHQVVYLARLVELAERYEPGVLRARLNAREYVYVDVPYRIHGIDRIMEDPKSTIDFDAERAAILSKASETLGAEGNLVRDLRGELVRVSLAEKLLTPLLVKLTNLVPGGGIWMNTQRPEWNDANNALVGFGLSVVTSAHLHRALALWGDLFEQATAPLELSAGLGQLLSDLRELLQEGPPAQLDSVARGRMVLALGQAGTQHRAAVYSGAAWEGTRHVELSEVQELLEAARRWTHQTLLDNHREDGLYHTYNLMRRGSAGALGIERLDLMLEGQVAMLSSGLLDGAQALDLLKALRASSLYRANQESYLLYPDRELPTLLEKGRIPAEQVAGIPVFARLVDAGASSILRKDLRGCVRFAPSLNNARALKEAMLELASTPFGPLNAGERDELLQVYEQVFAHRAFTGRSLAFFKYEGLGCIYWHMVSKLLLATQELTFDAEYADRSALVVAYGELRRGLGTHKHPAQYGAFPTDPYSHTPGDGGARQPGLTGQVKEDFLSRLGELGLWVSDGRLGFRAELLCGNEGLREAQTWPYVDGAGCEQILELESGSFGMTYCQVPIVVRRGAQDEVQVYWTTGGQRTFAEARMDVDTSRALFCRDGSIARIEVRLN